MNAIEKLEELGYKRDECSCNRWIKRYEEFDSCITIKYSKEEAIPLIEEINPKGNCIIEGTMFLSTRMIQSKSDIKHFKKLFNSIQPEWIKIKRCRLSKEAFITHMNTLLKELYNKK